MTAVWIACVLAAPTALVLTGLMRRVAVRQNMVDVPVERSSHTVPTPRGGGLSFVALFLLWAALALALGLDLRPAPGPALFLLGPLALLGYLDDRTDLPAKLRLGAHFAVALAAVAVFGPLDAAGLTNGFLPGWTAWPLSVVFVAACINFYNFMDGLDALVAGCCLVQLAFFSWSAGQTLWPPLAAGILGFLYWNRPPAKIFMGDAASTLLGGAAALAILAHPGPPAQTATALAATFPLTLDAAYTVLRRLARRENVLQAHRSHIYQRLHSRAGWSHGRVALAYAGLTAAFAAASAAGGLCAALGLGLALVVLAETYLALGGERRAH